ncbi:MAG: type II secretion system protein [Candidatus Doudnabacteria bacterium]
MRNIFNKKNQGFTLIELLVVIAIIGILAAVVLVSLNSARAKSRDARRVADVRQIMTALELFYNDNNGYPAATAAGSCVPATAASTCPTGGSPAFSTYLANYPTAPTPADTATCSAVALTNNNYYNYTQTGSGTGYSITFCLGGVTGGLLAGVHTATSAGIQ